MTTILLLYDSRGGLTEQLADSVAEGISAAGAEYVLTLHGSSTATGASDRPHTWSPADVPPEWDRIISTVGL